MIRIWGCENCLHCQQSYCYLLQATRVFLSPSIVSFGGRGPKQMAETAEGCRNVPNASLCASDDWYFCSQVLPTGPGIISPQQVVWDWSSIRQEARAQSATRSNHSWSISSSETGSLNTPSPCRAFGNPCSRWSYATFPLGQPLSCSIRCYQPLTIKSRVFILALSLLYTQSIPRHTISTQDCIHVK